jgi:hypothetical protein
MTRAKARSSFMSAPARSRMPPSGRLRIDCAGHDSPSPQARIGPGPCVSGPGYAPLTSLPISPRRSASCFSAWRPVPNRPGPASHAMLVKRGADGLLEVRNTVFEATAVGDRPLRPSSSQCQAIATVRQRRASNQAHPRTKDVPAGCGSGNVKARDGQLLETRRATAVGIDDSHDLNPSRRCRHRGPRVWDDHRRHESGIRRLRRALTIGTAPRE